MRIVNMQYSAGIQLHGRNKPLKKVEKVKKDWDTKKDIREFMSGKKTMKERKELLLKKKQFLDRKTYEYLEDIGVINKK